MYDNDLSDDASDFWEEVYKKDRPIRYWWGIQIEKLKDWYIRTFRPDKYIPF